MSLHPSPAVVGLTWVLCLKHVVVDPAACCLFVESFLWPRSLPSCPQLPSLSRVLLLLHASRSHPSTSMASSRVPLLYC